MISPVPHKANADQESVWDFPRPAIAQLIASHLKISHFGKTIAETQHGVRTLETSHPPSYYFPRADVAMELLTESDDHSFCEWKGNAVYFDVTVQGKTLKNVAWSYPNPTSSFIMLKNHIAFYAAPFELCLVDGEKALPQPGEFYGGWVTSKFSGPFKGVAGSRFW